LSTFLRAHAAALQPDASLFRLCAADLVSAPRYVLKLGAKDVASVVWAFSKAKVTAPLLFKTLAKRCVALMESFQPREFAEVAWAYARASDADDSVSSDFPHAALFEAIALQAPLKLESFAARDLATVVWAFSKVGFQAPLLFEAVATEALTKLHFFKAQDFSNTVWAFAKAGACTDSARALFEAVASKAPVSTFNPQDLSNTVWAFATLRSNAPELFEAVAETAPRLLAECTEQELVTLVRGRRPWKALQIPWKYL
jgi:hypothetical protein